jgi:hypothetical protein
VHHSIEGKFAIRQGRWKLELCPGSGGWSEPKDPQAVRQGLPAIQLYDMTQDIRERRNLQDRHPEVVKRLTALLQQYLAQGRSTPGAAQKNDAAVDIWKQPAKMNNGSSPQPRLQWPGSRNHPPQVVRYDDPDELSALGD